MPLQTVLVRAAVPRPAAEVWAILSDFAGLWHPAMTGIAGETDGRGALVRRFTVAGEDTVYREQRTYVSDSDRVLGYTHLEGIAGCKAYDARIVVTEAGRASQVEWSATVAAPEPRLEAICRGTEAIFRMGIAALATAPLPVARPVAAPSVNPIAAEVVDGAPRLALSVTPDRGEAVLALFLHGIGGNRTNWHGQLAALPPGIRGAALDLRGYGESALGPRQTTLSDHLADIDRVAAALDARRLVLVGMSFGAWIATAYATAHADLAGLVLAGGCTGMSEAGADERAAFRQAREAPLDAGQTPADFAPAVVAMLAGPGADDALRRTLHASMAAIPTVTYRDALNCFTNPPGRFDFARLSMPVLMMTGQHDRLAPPAEIRSVAARFVARAPRPSVRFEVLADAGHLCNLEQPAAFGARLAAFLQDGTR